MNLVRSLAVTAAALAFTAPARAGTYYLFDGDSSVAYMLSTDTGTVLGSFATAFLAYPAAIRSSIWLGHRDDARGWEYSLQGSPTGRTSRGGGNFTQLLDGATGTQGMNYGVECCGDTPSDNSVTVASANWSGQRVLFNLDFHADGIAFDPRDRSLYVSDFLSTQVKQFSLDGVLLNTLDMQQVLVGLAYDTATKSFWGFNRFTNNLVQFDRRGRILTDLDIPDFAPHNPWGGEMQAIPEPTALLLAAVGLPMLASVAALRRARCRCS